ncbi:hypothetical protein [Tichowtungia aerotolerans]|uniref:Uncharacterized protein n=1 Tax=Tichowtungia aerotolerans TaxID=2697043 RepID=A0A6P1MD35_9BACT|nr:hypothetical protein [Tichowtungia aerotolerans]QHI69005.1 hypothetical protein GT409_05950 [Tichowtungia aerotolerans]
MDQIENILIGSLFLTVYGWRIARPYLFYRDVVSGAITCDATGYILTQGVISGGVAIYWISQIGLISVADWLIMFAFLSMAVLSFYFGIKAWWWNKNKMKIEPGNREIRA